METGEQEQTEGTENESKALELNNNRRELCKLLRRQIDFVVLTLLRFLCVLLFENLRNSGGLHHVCKSCSRSID